MTPSTPPPATSPACRSPPLRRAGVTLTNVTLGTRLKAIDAATYSGGAVPVPSSPPNFFTQVGLNQPVTFTMLLATNVQQVQFTRVALTAGPNGVSHPQWSAHALDANGNEIQAVSEALITSSTDVPARTFLLVGANIARIRFDSDSKQTANFSAVLLDDIVLNTAAFNGINPLSINLTSPADNSSATAPASFTLTANVFDGYQSINQVAFFVGSTYVGSSFSGPPYSLTVSNLLTGSYLFTAEALDSSGYVRLSAPIHATVTPGVGNSSLVNFDSLDATGGPVSGAALSNYLAGNNMTAINLTPGSTLTVQNQSVIAGGNAVNASSPPNILTLSGARGPESFTLDFTSPLIDFTFTRPQLDANPFVAHPRWQDTFDAPRRPAGLG